MDVPEIMLKLTLLLSLFSPVGPTVGGHAANIFMPGAVTSGLITSGPTKLGPLDENAAIIGAAVTPNEVAGKTCASAKTSSPSFSVFSKSIPAPPAFFTSSPFSARPFNPRSQRTIFPLTSFGVKEPLTQNIELRLLLPAVFP